MSDTKTTTPATTNTPKASKVDPKGTKPATQQAQGAKTATKVDAKMQSTKSAEKQPKAEKKAKAPSKPKPKKMSALDAAAKVLQEAGKEMNCKEMIGVMALKKYWKSPAGKTPHSTLYAALMREINTKGKEARFKKTSPGKFAFQATAVKTETTKS